MSTQEISTERYIVPALERGLRILAEFNRKEKVLGAPELARKLKLPRSTIFRLLSTLEAMGYLEKTDSGREYRLGIAVLRLGFEYIASLDVVELSAGILQRLSAATGHSCSLVVRDKRSVVYVARVIPPIIFSSNVSIGTRLPVYATAFGRVLVQDLSLEELQDLYPEESLESFSETTPSNASELYAMAQADKQKGYASSRGHFERNISTLVVPVRDQSRLVIAAIGVTFSSSKFDGDFDELALAAKVQAAAKELSLMLNYSEKL